MEQIGVMAVVEGLSSFTSDMGKVESAISGIVPPASILQDAFGALGKAAGDFASWVGDVLTVALGNLLADAIETVISYIGEMINKTIEAGNEFQTLTLRLNGINLDTFMKSGMDYNEAMTQSVELTKEQLEWLQLLAMQTPFDNTDISLTYTMARTYQFADDQARALVEDVANVTAGMGLEKSAMKEIIRNLGQMAAKGKITGREMTDLANRQVPVIDILKRVAETLNKTGGSFTNAAGEVVDWSDKAKEGAITYTDVMNQISKPITAGGGMDFKLFIDGFQQMADEEARFIGAGERMARTFKAAQDNVNDLVTSFGGLNTVVPVLDVLGGFIADFMDNFSSNVDGVRSFTELGERLKAAFISVGESLASVVRGILGLAPSSDVLAEGLVGGLETLASWLTNNKDDIVNKVREIWDWLMSLGQSDFVSGLISQLQSLYNQLFNVMNAGDIPGWQMLKFAIEDVAKAIGGIFTSVIRTLGFDLGDVSFDIRDLVFALLEVSAWIRENRELLTWLLILVGGFIIIQTIVNLVMGLLISLIGMAAGVLTVVTAVGLLSTAFFVIIGIVTAVIGVFKLAQIHFSNVVIGIQFGIDLIVGYFNNMRNTIANIWTEINNAGRRQDWNGVGWAIVSGIARGIASNVSLVISAAQNAAMSAYNAAKNVLGIKSPSTMFSGIGENIMAGMAEGINQSASVAVRAMQGAVSAVAMPAMSAPAITQQYTQAPKTISNTYQANNSYNLSINSSANTEPIIQDFNMLQSMAGV